MILQWCEWCFLSLVSKIRQPEQSSAIASLSCMSRSFQNNSTKFPSTSKTLKAAGFLPFSQSQLLTFKEPSRCWPSTLVSFNKKNVVVFRVKVGNQASGCSGHSHGHSIAPSTLWKDHSFNHSFIATSSQVGPDIGNPSNLFVGNVGNVKNVQKYPLTSIQWIGLREMLQESPICNGKIYGFL